MMEFSETEYDSLLASLSAGHPSVQHVGFVPGAFNPGLDGMERFTQRLGHPERRFRTIHVAGTNGKGSVCSMLAASLASKGLSVGLYTSPHLLDFRERIRICDSEGVSMIPRENVFEFLSGGIPEELSFFEVTTGMAFKWFADRNVDIAVIETGLGGRLDSTNVIVPELSIITSIGLDHCAILGDTREKIAAEKAGIFKSGVPALVASRDEGTSPVFEETASRVHCPLFFADEMYELPDTSSYDLEGPCQPVNARTVFAALDLLGMDIDEEVIAHTAALTGFRGRWERLRENPETICDIAHNPPALEINFRRLEQSGRPLAVVYGVMADKDLDGIAPLMPGNARYFVAAPANQRSLPVGALYERLKSLRPDLDISAAASVAEAVRLATEYASGIPGSLIYIGGSTFVVSEAVSYPD